MENCNREIEVRFLEIDKKEIISKLKDIGASDKGESLVKELIFYDKGLEWLAAGNKFIRLRKINGKVFLTYKNQFEDSATGTEEIEFEVGDFEKAKMLLERIGFVGIRYQEKKRHTFILGDAIFDIDTWPAVPTYIEIEAHSEGALKQAANLLGLDWSKAVFENARKVLKKYYNIDVAKLSEFKFEKA